MLRKPLDQASPSQNKPAACHVLEPRPTSAVEDEDDDEYENDYNHRIDRTRFSLASSPFRASIKATEAYDRKSIVRTDRT
jgi:hypothetical protein